MKLETNPHFKPYIKKYFIKTSNLINSPIITISGTAGMIFTNFCWVPANWVHQPTLELFFFSLSCTHQLCIIGNTIPYNFVGFFIFGAHCFVTMTTFCII